jgi:phosphohistidine phosphatase
MAESKNVKTLHLLRHAKSSWDDPNLDDHDRPLAARGRQAAGVVASRMARQGTRVDLVLCSSAVRARQTFEFLLPVLGAPLYIHIGPELYTANASDLLRLIQAVSEEASGVLVVGHNPALEELTDWLAGDGEPGAVEELRRKFPTAVLATLTTGNAWSELGPGKAYLESFVLPGA